VIGEKCGITEATCFGKCSIHYAYSVSALWCSQVWLYFSY